ncbi:hypothetical protein [Pseudomonas sp. Irchel s3b5]|uniref:hypothetical protein n=1 Tax=Pseudomonas sp. Irchel s3b5 TaxID=2009077 RepID=UPI000BA37854|nr:hypothetical protein [Pseudomonas sp. Irchel s3b5]
MLNDYGKELFKPWISVQNIVLVIAMIFVIALLKLTRSELASWVQAVGSIAAIWAALRVVQIQQKKAQERISSELIAMAESILLLVREAGMQSAILASAVNCGTPLKVFRMNFLRRNKELMRFTLSALESVSISDLGSPLLLAMYLEISAAMSYMYRILEEVNTLDEDGVERYQMLCVDINSNNFWLQNMLKGFEAAHITRLESINDFK